MILCRRARLATALACLCFSIPPAAVAQQPAPPAQDKEKAKPPEAAKPPENPQPNKQNPLEAVPLPAEPAQPQAPKPPVPGRPTLEPPHTARDPKPDVLT